MERKNPLINGEVYHIFSRSIAEFKVFNNVRDYERMLKLFGFFQVANPSIKFSNFINAKSVQQDGYWNSLDLLINNQEKNVQIIAYCIMPTHIHLVLKQLKKNGISIYVGNILNSYTRYFNTVHRRKGPLWESKFQNVLVKDDEQLLHLTRYLHLNPVTANLVAKPEDWKASSYLEFIKPVMHKLCDFEGILEINSNYEKFVNDRIDYQRELAKIKKIILET
jgi:putative transposase